MALNRATSEGEIQWIIKKEVRKNLGRPSTTPCVFISHKNEDTGACEPIAQYLLDSGVDIYFDKYDINLAQIAQEGNSDKLTERLQEGIDKSTHMICVVSPQTINSYWVPFEVGYGYSKVKLGILTLDNIKDKELPDYMKTTQVIRGIKSLNQFIAVLLGKQRSTLEEQQVIKRHAMSGHPLEKVLDWSR